MRIGYLIDVNKGPYDQPMPPPDDVHRTLEQMVEEGIVAEKSGFHSLQVPHRHGRTECYYPGPEQLLTILARETDKVAIGTYTFVATLYHPMHAAEQFAIIDNLSKGRLYTTMSRGYHAGYWGQFGIPQEKMLGRFLESDQDLEGGVQGRAVRLRRQALAGRSRACSRPAPTRRAAGRSGAAATRAPRRSGARRSTARR